MKTIHFHLCLTSDAEPATGLGTDLRNSIVPRNERGVPVIPAAHLKGLLREVWEDISSVVDPFGVLGVILGSGTESGAEAHSVNQTRVGDSIVIGAWDEGHMRLAARTAIDRTTGGAQKQSLRVNEAIPSGTMFAGCIRHAGDAITGKALRLCLLSLPAIGGGRNRGSGRCVVSIVDESGNIPDGEYDPKQLLRQLVDEIANPQSDPSGNEARATSPTVPKDTEATELLRLDFHAEQPVLVPEWPDASNHLRSGDVIQPSAVEGMLVSMLADRRKRSGLSGKELAEALLAHPGFRAWPLLPVGSDTLSDNNYAPQIAPLSLLTEKNGEGWSDTLLSRAKLLDVPKRARGVLLPRANGCVQFLSTVGIARVVRAHAGITTREKCTDSPLLYTTEAIAPTQWSGLIQVPKSLVDEVQALDGTYVGFGRRRTVYGGGTLRVYAGRLGAWIHKVNGATHVAVVAQGPWLCPVQKSGLVPHQVVREIVGEWVATHKLPLDFIGVDGEGIQASIGMRFGWNRHKDGFQPAVLAVLPGSVCLLKVKTGSNVDVPSLEAALCAGVGKTARPGHLGFGAAACHPGIPQVAACISGAAARAAAKPSSKALRWALTWAERAEHLPSPSQLGRMTAYVQRDDVNKLEAFLEAQKKRSRFAADYEQLGRELMSCGTRDREELLQALRTLVDIRLGTMEESQ